jgi:hypothetical protein
LDEEKQVTREYTGESDNRGILLAILAILAIVVIVAAVWFWRRRSDNVTYTGYDIVTTKQLAFSTVYGMIPIKDGVMRYARDGVEAVGKDGKTMWNVSYNMSNPVADACGRYGAVGDAGGVSLYLLDGTGKVNSVTTDHPIVKVAVSANGETAVLMNGGKDDYMVVYHIDGTKASEVNTVTTSNGFPLDVAISENGAKIVLSFAYFDEENIRSRLVFYNFGNVGKTYTEGMVGKSESTTTAFPDNLYADVAFLTNDRIAVFGDKSVLLYEMEEIQSMKPVEITYTGTVRRFAYSGDYVGLLTEQQDNGHIVYAVLLYDLSGKLVERRELDNYYGGFRIEGTDVILYNDVSLYIYRVKGKDKYKGGISKPIAYIYAIDGRNRFAVVSDNQYNELKLLTGGSAK